MGDGLAPGMAMVLDMDGVIVNSNPLHEAAWVAYNRRFGMETGRELIARMYGKRNDEIVRDFFGSELDDAQIIAHGAAKERLYREMLAPKLRETLVPGVREFLAGQAPGTVALATNAEPANVDFILDGCALRAAFRVVIDGSQVKRPKPHPEIYLRAAELLGVPPRNCIVFEDSFSGVAAAQAAGTRVVGLRTTHSALPGAALEIDDFRSPQLEPWLLRQTPRAS